MTDSHLEMSLEAVALRRKYYWGQGFRPYPVWSSGALDHNGQEVKNAGKRAYGANWRQHAEQNPPRSTQIRPDSAALNTGFLCGELVAIDVDVEDAELVDQIVAMIEACVGRTPLIRQGRAPKTALCFRTDHPFSKIKTPELKLPDGSKAAVEVLATGQGLVADGIHPVTHEPYAWLDQHPLNVALSELPQLSELTARAVIKQSEQMLRVAGAVDWPKPDKGGGADPPRPRGQRRNAVDRSDGFFDRVNDVALEGAENWVRLIFVGAKRAPNGAWRIAASLRGLPPSKQDISVDPKNGIMDFALDEPMTPIDFVLEHRRPKPETVLEAALWLCTQLGVAPEKLGYRDRPEEPPPHQTVPDGSPGDGPGLEEPPPRDKSPDGPRPQRDIFVTGGMRHRVSEEGLAALKENDIEFYVRDHELVRICPIKMKASDGTTIIVPAIVRLPLTSLGRALGQTARWLRYDDKGRIRRIDPPRPVVEQIAGMVDQWPFPPLAGLASTPTMRPDGTLLAKEGYDEQTGLVLILGNLKMPAIRDRPTKAEAETALAVLLEILQGFPFTSESSRSVALSMFITPVVRAALPVAPLHLVSAPLPGTGKSYLADIAATIATGERAAVLAQGTKEEETEKRLIGAALSGHPIIVLDNVRRVLEGDFLCQVTERPLLQLRPLGTSDEHRVSNTFTAFADGNNLVVADDMVRRCIKASLDANVEDPEMRTFASDPLAQVVDDRGRYVAACLTIVRAYIVAGKPNRCKRLPSYGAWNDLVRSSLVWLGQADPLDTMSALRREDPVRQQRAEVFTAWSELKELDLGGITTGALIGKADGSPDLREALLNIAAGSGQNAGKIDPKRLGNWLKSQVNAIAAGFKLEVDRCDRSRPKWILSPMVTTDKPEC